MPVLRKALVILSKSHLKKIVMDVNEVLCHGENGGATWETSHGGCIMRKVVSKEVTAGGRFDFFWTLFGGNMLSKIGFLKPSLFLSATAIVEHPVVLPQYT